MKRGAGREDLPFGEWLCVRHYCWRVMPLLRATVAACFDLAKIVAPQRTLMERWIRYGVDLADTFPAPPDVRLTPVTNDFVRALCEHPDRFENQLKSGLRFWNHGLKRAYVWTGDDGPLCIQWLLITADNSRLRTLPDWAGMYPALPPGVGQVENLFAFSSARRRGVATQFEHALYEEARRLGQRHLITHIHEANSAARGWADRTGWRAYGTITRYQLDFPGVRGFAVFLHRKC